MQNFNGSQRELSTRAFYRLAAAMLLQAIHDATSRSAGRRASAIQWMYRSDDGCFSFPFICQILDRSPEDVRRFCEREQGQQRRAELLGCELVN